MPHLTTDDGVKLYYEEVGSGVPIVFVHEFAGDTRSWESQMRHFCRRYRCIAFNARGYPPSDVPDAGEKYAQARARDDIRGVLDALPNTLPERIERLVRDADKLPTDRLWHAPLLTQPCSHSPAVSGSPALTCVCPWLFR